MSMPGGGAAASSATLVGLEAMKVTELRSRCAALGERTDGRKVDLVARLYTGMMRRPPPPPPNGGPSSPRQKRKRPLEEGDERLVNEVRGYMKENKLSQVMVGQEARVSQAVISQWLSRKYHGHNAKVDSAMRHWLSARRAGRVCMPSPDEPTSVLRPSRSTTFAEKRVREKRRKEEMMMMGAAESSGFGPGALSQLMQVAAQAHNEPAGDPPAADLGGTPTRPAPEINVGDDVFQLAELAAQTMVDLEASPSKPPPGRKLVSPDPGSERGRNAPIGAALLLSEPIQQPPAEIRPNRIVSNLSRCYSSELGAEALTPGIGARSTEGDGAYRQSPPISPQPNSPRAREQTPSHGAKTLAGAKEPGSASEEASVGELVVLSTGR